MNMIKSMLIGTAKRFALLDGYHDQRSESNKLLSGNTLSHSVRMLPDEAPLREAEFSVFSQFGDDGIIQYLIQRVPITSRTFIEFGVEDYSESSTRFLLMNDNWSGFVMDGSSANMDQLRKWHLFWKYDIVCHAAFVDCDNINNLLQASGFGSDLGLLHIDIDGNDYWVWEAINSVDPAIVVVEYNSVFGCDRAITVPYQPDFVRTQAHFSNLYWGSSLPALSHLADQKGYAFVGSNSAGNNAYFVRRDLLGRIREVSVDEGYVESKYRESRDENGALTYLRGRDRLNIIRGLPVVDVLTGETVQL